MDCAKCGVVKIDGEGSICAMEAKPSRPKSH